MAAAIEVKGVTNRFGSQTVHDSIDLTLEENEILGLVGGSGSGKSVLLRTVLGLHRPQSGEVVIDGTDIVSLTSDQRLEIQKKWGVLFQNGALFSGLSVLDNVGLPLREHTGLSPEAIDNLVALKLKMVGLEDEALAKYPEKLSGGMVTRAAIARALALDPPILFLDEPTGALDPASATGIDELMKSLRDILGLSIFIITHDVATLATICDRIAMIVDKKVKVGTLKEMLDSEDDKVRAFFSGPRMAAIGPRARKGN